ncbi:MAG TPA: hypothetical protein VHM26_08855 [Chitinophagaceae bacterium]|jgi:hypothetical protein|nr:hypothetical protein [Chitinophagaceae bacterium]
MFSFFKKKKAEPLSEAEQLAAWEREGKPYPPPHVIKQKAISYYRDKYHTPVLVETGTYMGDMVEAQKQYFKQVYSIELSKKLYGRAIKRFKGQSTIHLLQGDSGVRLKEITAQLKEPALFWLDGHYSGGITAMGDKECPVREELAAILPDTKEHVILIDDARLFNGTHDYPTIEELQSLVDKYGGRYRIENTDDIIRLLPKDKV